MKVSPKWVKSLHLSESDDFDFKNTIDNSKREFSLKLETKNLKKSLARKNVKHKNFADFQIYCIWRPRKFFFQKICNSQGRFLNVARFFNSILNSIMELKIFCLKHYLNWIELFKGELSNNCSISSSFFLDFGVQISRFWTKKWRFVEIRTWKAISSR